MNASDLSQLCHLAEKVMGRKLSTTTDPAHWDNQYYVGEGQITFFVRHEARREHDGKVATGWFVWNPLDDANDCRELVEKIDKPMEVFRSSFYWGPRRWHARFVVPSEYGADAYGPTQERAVCLAAARMTGWQEPEESK